MPFIDLAAHILPGVDDGPPTMAESILMAQAAALQGTSTIVSAPHRNDVELNSSIEEVRQLVADLNSRLRRDAAEGAPSIRVVHGIENRITPSLPDRIEPGDLFTINNSRFVLLSTPFSSFPPFMTDVLARLRMKRLVPILARPERNEVLRRDPGKMRDLIEDGVLFVVTAGSITGAFGKGAQRAGLRMIQQRIAHAVVSDMHGLEGSRPPSLRRAYRWVERATDEATADRLLDHQPRMILQGHSPEAESEDAENPGGIWRRLSPVGLLRRGG